MVLKNRFSIIAIVASGISIGMVLHTSSADDISSNSEGDSGRIFSVQGSNGQTHYCKEIRRRSGSGEIRSQGREYRRGEDRESDYAAGRRGEV